MIFKSDLITKEDIEANGQYGQVLHDKFKAAAKRLNWSLKHIPVTEDWRELLQLFRDECVGPWVTLTVNGAPQRIYVDSREGECHIHEQDFRYNNLGPQMRELHEAVLAIETFDAAKVICPPVKSLVASINAGADRPNAKIRSEKLDEIGAWLNQRNYQHSSDKNTLIVQATERFKCGETDIKDAARLAGLTRTYRKSSK